MVLMIEVLRLLVLLFFAVPVFVFGLYGLILVYYYRREGSSKVIAKTGLESEFQPFVSVITPTHNEETIIAKKIDNLLSSNYPTAKLELIFVDDSNDSTTHIIEEYSLKYSNVSLIRFNNRMGYSPCMFEGIKKSKGSVIVLSDAGSFHDGNTISKLIRHFCDPRVGAVSGKDVILNVDEEVGSSEASYLKILDFVRSAETNMDSTFYFKGEASAVRKELISDLEDCGATFDTAVALFVRKKGYKTIFDPEARFYEYAPMKRSERVKQKTIRAANWIKILLKFRSMAFNYNYGKFGMFTLPANFGMLIATPVAILLGVCSLVVLTFFDPFFSLFLWSFLGAIALLSVILSRHLLGTFLDFEVSLLKALYEVRFTEKKHDQIDTVLSTRR